MRQLCLCCLFIGFFSSMALAQVEAQWGVMPSLNINKKFERDWSANFKAESRQVIEREDFKYTYQLTDFAIAGAKKLGIRTTLAMGYLGRVGANFTRHRAFQQLTIVKDYREFKLAHRLASDQTFSQTESPEFRGRYRLSAEVPLQGASLDRREFFLKVSNEYIAGWQQLSFEPEIRLATFLGFALREDQKVELGFEDRFDSFINAGGRHRYWIGINFFQSL